MIDPEILYQDENIVAINKPAGVAVHPDRVNERGTILDWARERWPEARLGHRLDKETSGVLLIAKTEASYEYLKKLFQAHQIKKTYLTLVVGKVKGERGTIDLPIGHHPADARKRIAGDPTESSKLRGKFREARTDYSVLERLGDFTLVEARPHTGRTHQIRVHFKAIGYPILGDKLYNSKPTALINRQALHAVRLELILSSGQPLVLEAPLPADFTEALDSLRASC